MIATWQQLGNFGNCMFEYAATRIFAEKFNYEVRTDINFNGKDTHCEEFFTEFFNLEEKHNLPLSSFQGIYDGQLWDILRLTDHEFSESKYYCNNVRIEGYFQDPKLFTGKGVQRFFNLDESKFYDVGDNDLCLSLRLGSDYRSLGFVIDYGVFQDLLDNTTWDRLFIVTDEKDDCYLNNFSNYSPEIICHDGKNPIADFYILSSFKNLIIPNSTFSYWAAVLGKSTKIYAPADWKIDSEVAKLNKITDKERKTILYEI